MSPEDSQDTSAGEVQDASYNVAYSDIRGLESALLSLEKLYYQLPVPSLPSNEGFLMPSLPIYVPQRYWSPQLMTEDLPSLPNIKPTPYRALDSLVEVSKNRNDQRVGELWHTPFLQSCS